MHIHSRSDVQHVARAVVPLAELPLDTTVLFITIHDDGNFVCRAGFAAATMKIEDAKAQIDEYGYAVLKGALSSDQANALHDHSAELIVEEREVSGESRPAEPIVLF